MDIFKLAMEREKQMEQYYKMLASHCTNKALKTVLENLAAQESGHFNGIKKWAFRLAKAHETKVVQKSDAILSEITADSKIIDFSENQVELYAKARGYEQESEKFYRELVKKSSDKEEIEIFTSLANEEHKHYLIMDELVQHTNRPEMWVEAAEFSTKRIY